MPAHHETRTLPYTPHQLYTLVADIEKYPEFLPWCVAARITKRECKILFADLVIGFKMFREGYTSKVDLIAPATPGDPHIIDVTLVKGPFSHLTNRWEFAPTEQGTKLTFDLDFAFKSKILEKAIGTLFEKATNKMVEAFEQRAEALYGK